MGKNIRYGGKCNEDNNLLHCVLPGFVLALRDFTLKMIIDGRKVTPDEYLDVSLQNKTRKDGSFNKPLECIRKFFPQDKRRCFAFPVPGDGDTLESIDSLKLHDLSKTFQGVAAKFVSYIFSQEPKQLQVSKPVNGYMFASLTKQYVNDLSKGAVPDVDDAFTAVAKLENERVKKECLEIFQSRMDDILLPIPATKFNKHLTEARWCALKYMRENAVEDVANAVEKYAESLNDLKTELQNQTFEVLGGYKNFKRDVDIVKQEYEQALRDYEHREIVFPWSVVADWLGEAENRILEKDDALSEEEKQRERMEYSNSIERMKVEMAEANQTALDKQKNELEEQQKELNAERERLEKEHEHHVKMLQEKGMESESDKEHQNKARDQKKAKQKEDRASEYENTIQRLRDKIKKLKKMNKERKEKNIFSRVWNAICNI
ncbi:GBP2-like protein [Mya arenaria]|uniref:GBP2-like protein n=1 Tax=Mya arenaria TaxID=6604 RepID=A0ABY7EUV2_MYAAR|nr:GBP2-like protein [Mya arenaria]